MPNRILRDYTDSRKFEGISPNAERLFVRLLSKADDYGRFHSDSRLIRSACFPLEDVLRSKDIDAWVTELEQRRLILRYESKGKALLAIVNNRQRIKDGSKPKFPAPPGCAEGWLPDDDDQIPSSRNPREDPGRSRKIPEDPGRSGLDGGVGVCEDGGAGDARTRATPPLAAPGRQPNPGPTATASPPSNGQHSLSQAELITRERELLRVVQRIKELVGQGSAVDLLPEPKREYKRLKERAEILRRMLGVEV